MKYLRGVTFFDDVAAAEKAFAEVNADCRLQRHADGSASIVELVSHPIQPDQKPYAPA